MVRGLIKREFLVFAGRAARAPEFYRFRQRAACALAPAGPDPYNMQLFGV
jgi:hypothetical protein